jgi:hypothetical protein
MLSEIIEDHFVWVGYVFTVICQPLSNRKRLDFKILFNGF